MSDNEAKWDISTPTRQSYLGVVIYLIRNLRALATLFISLIAVAAAAPKFWTIAGISLIPLVILFAILAYWQYRNFTFHLEADNLIINKGVFVKDRKSVPVERIQSIQVTKNVLQRILGLVALKVDTAGSRGNELEIPALERERADALRDLLYARKEALSSKEETFNESVEKHGSTKTFKEESETLVKLSLIDLIKVGLTENHLKTGFLALAFVSAYLNQYQELLQEYLEGYIDTYADKVTDASLTLVISFLVFYALVSVALSMIRTFLRFYDLRAVLNREAVEINSGLLQKNEYRIPKNKVQFIQFDTNPLRRLVGYESATLKPSNSVGDTGKKQTIEIPALQSVKSNILATGIFPDAKQPEMVIMADHWAYARLYSLISLFLIVPICTLLAWQFSFLGLTSLLFVLPFAAYGYRYGKTVRIYYDRYFVYVKRGWLFPKKVVMPAYKAQSLKLSQNIILKKRKIAHLTLFTAAGNKTVRFLHESEVLHLYNFLLKAVEKHEGSWM